MARLIGIALLVLGLAVGSVAAQDAGGLSVEFYGTVQSASATAAVINGQLVGISTAEISTPLVAGATVRVHATLAADGSLSAREIEAASSGLIPGIVEIEGAITAVNGSAVTIGDDVIDISSAGVGGQLAVGQVVRIYAVATAPHQWRARLIVSTAALQQPIAPPPVATAELTPAQAAVPAIATTPEAGEDFKVFGTVTAFDGTTITIDGQRFFVGSARLDSGIAVGVQVRMEIRVIDGEWVIEEIETANGDDRGGNDDVAGDDHGGNSGHGSDDSGGDDHGGNSGHGSDDSGGDDHGGHGGDD